MSAQRIRRALISVYDKTGIVEFARALREEFGIEIISTGGTAKLLGDNGIAVTLVEEITGFGELLGGRVKTLHPKIHAAILADRDNPEHMRQLAELGVEPIDMVVVNLYPFAETIARSDCTPAEAIEMIDIGGPCLLRAAAKNHKHVLVVTDPIMYKGVLAFCDKDTEPVARMRRVSANAAFRLTQEYDQIIDWYLSGRSIEEMGDAEDFAAARAFLHTYLRKTAELRYGENPHQKANLYRTQASDEACLLDADMVTAEAEMSFNNYADAGAALDLCAELTRASQIGWHRLPAGDSDQGGGGTGGQRSGGTEEADATEEARGSSGASGKRDARTKCCVFVKHTNACGAAVGDDSIDTYRRAYLGDPQAAMGGVLAVNFGVDAGFADAVMKSLDRWGKDAGAGAFFVEVWVAPSFDDEAVKFIQSAKPWGKRVRLLAVGDINAPPDENELDLRRITGGMLIQTRDLIGLNEDQWKLVTKRAPTDQEMADLRLAWLICKHTKSNAITICKDGMLIGNGSGQMSRVMSCRIATWLVEENGHTDKLPGSVAASDAFFPFRDGPELLIDAGVTAIIQPGGSKRDHETIAACDERDVAMVFTGTRHFKH